MAIHKTTTAKEDKDKWATPWWAYPFYSQRHGQRSQRQQQAADVCVV